jgi:NADPH-dependent 2,4-dienoyl-CoA reductase/sulfur reductase-like enzyme/nitrite reductase/ring-hydroxylating ferredoxin subunit
MAQTKKTPSGPDLTAGVPVNELEATGQLLGHVGDEDVLVAKVNDEILAVGAACTHYRGPLAEGLIVGDTVRCPWHHSCFSLRTGEPIRPPALDRIACWRVDVIGDRFVVREKMPLSKMHGGSHEPTQESMVIVGGGAAGLAAADTLRREGYRGALTIVSADADAPYDRPNLSKDYLAGTAPEDWMPLRGDSYFTEQKIGLKLGARVDSLDTARRAVRLEDGMSLPYGALLLATGATPVKLTVDGAADPRVHYLRSFHDARAIIAKLSQGTRAAVVGASFIGLEVAASLRARGIDTHVIAPVARPMEQIMGPEVGDFVRKLHESHGVVFHLGDSVASIDRRSLTLASGGSIAADIIIVGIGVKPVTDLMERSGLHTDNGINVNEYLETSTPGIFAAGDIARWPDSHSGERIRVEHWVVAQRQGQTAARNMLGRREPFDAVPFFWSQHYDITINYVGHASHWDSIEREGDLDGHDCLLRFLREGRTMAVASIGRDRANLLSEVELEHQARLLRA